MRKSLLMTAAALAFVAGAAAGLRPRAQHHTQTRQTHDCPMRKGHHSAGMNERGEKAMGFSQEKTTHHFYLTGSGGVIQVETKDPQDAAGREQIRQHLRHIASMFAAGDFEIPMFVHGRVPPGVPEMKRLRSSIRYEYEEAERGGRVRLSSDDPQAVAAIHSFLRFQITEHQTGDSLEVGRGPAPPALE